MSLLVQSDDRQRFATNGYLLLDVAVPPTTVDMLRAEADTLRDRLLAAMTSTRSVDARITWWRLTNGHPYLLKIKPAVPACPVAAELALDGPLAAMAGDLLGARAVLMEDKFMYKQQLDISARWADLPVLGEEVRKHTDAAYFAARGYDQVITVAVCLDDCTAEAGPLKVWPGTHRRQPTMIWTERQGPVVADADTPEAEAVTLIAPAGTVLAWDSALVHASGPNVSGKPRRLLVLGYAAQEAGAL